MTIREFLEKNKIKYLTSGNELVIHCLECQKTDLSGNKIFTLHINASGGGQCENQECRKSYTFDELAKALNFKPETDDEEAVETESSDYKSENSDKKQTFAVSEILSDGSMAETVYDPVEGTTQFAVYKDGVVDYMDAIKTDKGQVLVPYPPDNDLIKKEVVLFPACAEKFGSEADLIKIIQSFIHQYLDIDEYFEKVATYYVLLSWVYYKFNELPYLRALGYLGCGKTRFLQTVGYLCYKPTFAGGATTTAPIFRILNEFRGTLVLDEADFKASDATVDIIKILNNGFAKGFPVWRCEGKNKFEVKTFEVFGPKLLATRGEFQDKALESRSLTVEMEKGAIRKDIPINIPDSFYEEARSIRNKLLSWRFLNYGRAHLKPELKDEALEPRLNQITLPLLSIIEDKDMINELKISMRAYNDKLISDRGLELAGQILEAITTLNKTFSLSDITMKDIADTFNLESEDLKEKISAKKTGWVVRKQLRLEVEHKRNGYVLMESNKNKEKLEFLKTKYGLKDEQPEKSGGVNNDNVVNNEIVIEEKNNQQNNKDINPSNDVNNVNN